MCTVSKLAWNKNNNSTVSGTCDERTSFGPAQTVPTLQVVSFCQDTVEPVYNDQGTDQRWSLLTSDCYGKGIYIEAKLVFSPSEWSLWAGGCL